MSDPLPKDLALDRYVRLLRGAAGVSCSVAYCSPDGETLWTADGSDTAEVADATRELSGFESVPNGSTAQRLDLGGGRSVLQAAIRSGRPGEAAPAGLLVVLPERGLSDDRMTALADVLSDLTVCIENEHRLNREANELAGELSSRYEELNLLYSMGGHVRAYDEGAVGAKALLANLAERLEIDFAGFVLSRDVAPIYVANTSHPIPNLDLLLTAIAGDLFRFACTGRTPVILNTLDDPRRPYLLANMPYRVLACPVVDSVTQNAMLVLMRTDDRPEFTNGDRSLATVIASQTAIMMQNHGMLRSLQKFGVQMAGALIEAIEAKDPYTRGHSERVQKISVKLGKAAELTASAIDDISWGALLHDVGKIGVPDPIICKAGKLTKDEYTMVKIHPERSYEIIRHIEELSQGALNAARYHHERFDGGGYPHGLRGKQIPVAARIISIGDTYDAVTSSRSYRAASGHEAALRIIREAAGTQLDAELVEVFENLCARDPSTWRAIDPPDEGPDG